MAANLNDVITNSTDYMEKDNTSNGFVEKDAEVNCTEIDKVIENEKEAFEKI